MNRAVPVAVAALTWLLLVAWAARLSATAGVTALAVFGLFCARLGLAWRNAPAAGDPPPLRVSVVLPVYNEDPHLLLRGLASLAAQTHPPDRVWVIDDGSDEPAALEAARTFRGPFELVLVRCRVNRGKRRAQAAAFRRDRDADVFVTADSDTVFHRDAIREGLRPFHDRQVTAVAGLVRPLNRTRNLLTRLQDAEYLSSFLLERASLSSLRGSVLVTSGGLAVYRADVVRAVLDEYVGQTFAGRPVHTGDDRMLTQLALQRGRVVFQHTAVADTAVPERLSHLLRQRVRWSRSFWVNSLWVFGHLRPGSWPYWLVAYYLTSVMALLLSLAIVAVVVPELGLFYAATFLLMVLGLSYVRAARLLTVELPGSTPAQRLATYLTVGPAVVFNLVVLMPVRLWALLRIRQVSRWGTRQQIELGVAAPAGGEAQRRQAPVSPGSVGAVSTASSSSRSSA